jgi:hypothetical protein
MSDDTKGRTVIYCNNAGASLLLAGKEDNVPDLCCGECSTPLARGISQSRFVKSSPPGMKLIKLSPGGGGPIVISGPLPLTDNSAFIEAAILSCPKCKKFNETSIEPVTVQ